DRALDIQRRVALTFAAHPDVRATREALRDAAAQVEAVRADARRLIRDTVPGASAADTDYVFLSFVLAHLPVGLVGLLIAVILCAAMSAVSSGLISLGTTTTVDFYLRVRSALGRPRGSPEQDLRVSKLATVLWGALILAFASAASMFENLIQA